MFMHEFYTCQCGAVGKSVAILHLSTGGGRSLPHLKALFYINFIDSGNFTSAVMS